MAPGCDSGKAAAAAAVAVAAAAAAERCLVLAASPTRADTRVALAPGAWAIKTEQMGQNKHQQAASSSGDKHIFSSLFPSCKKN